MPIVVVAFTQAFIKSHWMDSAVKGINASGDDCQYADDLETPCDLAMHTSGVKGTKGLITESRRFLIEKYDWRRLIVESRCFRKNFHGGREKYWRLSLGGFLDDEAIYHPPGFVADSERWEMVKREQGIEIKRWRETGDHILLCGQKLSDASLRGQNVDEWFDQTIALLREYTKRDVVIRPHPLDPHGYKRLRDRKSPGVRMSDNEDLEADLKNAWAMVTFTSLSSIEAACEGIPIFATNSGNLSWKVANQDLRAIENPKTFDREPWLWDLAYRQWKITELEEGRPWRRLREAFVEKARNEV